jgi:hypothetical protein
LFLLTDMVLDDDRSGPLRHLLAALKLLATSGGGVRSAGAYRELLGQVGLRSMRFYRLTTTNLILACTDDTFMPTLSGASGRR